MIYITFRTLSDQDSIHEIPKSNVNCESSFVTEDASVSASSVSKQFAHFVIFSGILKGSVQPSVGCFLVTKRMETMQEANQSANG